MPDYTPNLNLKKPLKNENYNVDDTNENMNKIDLKFREVESYLEETVTKPTTAIGNNIVIFDTNQDKLKDSGKSIGNTSGKILELPTGLTIGDLLRVGTSGQIERLPKGIDEQVLVMSGGLPSWGNGSAWEKIAEVTLTNDVSQVDFTDLNLENYKCIKLISSLKSTLISEGGQRGVLIKFNNDDGANYDMNGTVIMGETSTTIGARNTENIGLSAISDDSALPSVTMPPATLILDIFNTNKSECKQVIYQIKGSRIVSPTWKYRRNDGIAVWKNKMDKINRISVLANADLIATGSTFTLMGVK